MRLFDNVAALFSFRPAAVTTTTNGTAVDTLGFNDGMVVLEVGAVSGTTPTMTVTIEESADGATGWTATGLSFTQVTAANNTQVLRLAELNVVRRRFVRAVATIGGTTPSFTFGCEVLLGDRAIGNPINND
jgi:hypothetical protein